jgi:hypothetical protein
VTALVAQVRGLAQAAPATLAVAPAALNETTALLRDAEPGLRNAYATLRLAQRAVSPTLGFLHTAQPALPEIDQAMASLLPVVRYVAPRSCGLSDVSMWSPWMKFGTSLNNWIRFTVAESSSIVAGAKNAPVLSTPYPSPCHGSVGEGGGARPTPEQQAAKP